jgi:hypothetical protein
VAGSASPGLTYRPAGARWQVASPIALRGSRPSQPVQVALKAGDLALEVQRPIFADTSSLPDPEVAHFPHERELSLDLMGLRCEISRGKGLPLR